MRHQLLDEGPMKIIQWAYPYLPTMGGREIFVQRLCKSLTSAGHEIHVIASPPANNEFVDPNYIHAEEFPVYRHDLRKAMLSKDSAQVEAARNRLLVDLTRVQPDVIHIHTCGPEIVMLRDTLRLGKINAKFVYTHHGLNEDHTFWRYSLSMVDKIVAVSQHSYEQIQHAVPSTAAKLIVIRNGVPVEPEYAPLGDSHQEIFAFGRLSAEKGFHLLLDAWASLQSRILELRLVIAGEGVDGSALRAQCKRLGIADTVSLPGWLSQEQISQKLDGSRLVVVPSTYEEPFGLVAAEAHAKARPVIASRIGGLPEIVVEGETGLLVQPNNVEALAQALGAAMHDLPRLQTMGEKAHARAMKELNWETCVLEYEELFQNLVTSCD